MKMTLHAPQPTHHHTNSMSAISLLLHIRFLLANLLGLCLKYWPQYGYSSLTEISVSMHTVTIRNFSNPVNGKWLHLLHLTMGFWSLAPKCKAFHENVIFSVCMGMRKAAYIIIIIWNFISG